MQIDRRTYLVIWVENATVIREVNMGWGVLDDIYIVLVIVLYYGPFVLY